MVRKPFIIALLLLGVALMALGADKPYYQYPDATSLPDNSRVLLYDGSSKNITGHELKKQILTPFYNWTSTHRRAPARGDNFRFGNLSTNRITADSITVSQGAEAQSIELLEALSNGSNSVTVGVSEALAGNHTLLLTDSGLLFDGQPAGGASDATQVSYSNTTYTTVAAALDSLLYVPISITSYTMNGSGSVTQEIGSSFTVSTLAWATNKASYTSTINSVSRTSPYSVGATVSTGTSYNLSVTDGTSTATSSRSVSFTHKRYWGVNAAATLTDADIILLSSEFSTSRVQSRTLTPSAQYMYFVYMADGGDATFTVNGFLDTSWVLVTRDFVNASLYSYSFRIYRSANPLTGSYSVVVS